MIGKLWFMLFLFSSCNSKFALANNELCDLCVDIVSSIEAYLQDGHTQEEIIAVLDQVKILFQICRKNPYEKIFIFHFYQIGTESPLK